MAAIGTGALGSYIDLGPRELLAAANGLELPREPWIWLAASPDDVGEHYLRAGQRSLQDRGLAASSSDGAWLDPYLSEILEVGSAPARAVVVAVVTAKAVTFSWLLAQASRTSIFTLMGPEGIIRARLIPTEQLPGALVRLADLDVNAMGGTGEVSLAPDEITMLRRIMTSHPEDSDLAAHLELSKQVTAMAPILQSVRSAAAVITYQRGDEGHIRGEVVTWVTGEDGGLHSIATGQDGSLFLRPLDGQAMRKLIEAAVEGLGNPMRRGS